MSGGLRIVAGELKGQKLHTSKQKSLRPTTEMVREAIFSILGEISGARVLDLFCGSGALGIEALSRGAGAATLVDTRPDDAERNVRALGLRDRAEVVRADARRFLRKPEPEAFDIVLCDPPYKLADRLAAELDPLIQSRLAPGGRVVVETSPRRTMDLSLPLRLERAYGDTLVRLYERGDES